MGERREGLDDVTDEDRVDKPRKRKARPPRDRGTPTSHPEQHEEFAGPEQPASVQEQSRKDT